MDTTTCLVERNIHALDAFGVLTPKKILPTDLLAWVIVEFELVGTRTRAKVRVCVTMMAYPLIDLTELTQVPSRVYTVFGSLGMSLGRKPLSMNLCQVLGECLWTKSLAKSYGRQLL